MANKENRNGTSNEEQIRRGIRQIDKGFMLGVSSIATLSFFNGEIARYVALMQDGVGIYLVTKGARTVSREVNLRQLIGNEFKIKKSR